MSSEGQRVRVGGQALADGVLMRTERVWAVARADGSAECGELARNPVRRIPIVRSVVGLAGALRLGIGRGMFGHRSRRSRRVNARFLAALLVAEGLVLALALSLDGGSQPLFEKTTLTLLPWIVVLTVLRVATGPVLWRYHGAEHKAVSAHDDGVALDDIDAVLACSRIHDRCGTNLVFVMAVASLLLVAVPAGLHLPLFVLVLGASIETVSGASRRPYLLVSRVVLAGGRLLQRTVTTLEPTAAEQAVACRALRVCLAEHARMEAAEEPRPSPAPLPARV